MPFKTRQQKISARKRRFVFLESQTVNWERPSVKTIKTSGGGSVQANVRRIETTYEYVRHDLIKIFLLALLIISIQVILRLFLKNKI